jgi:hypothetical protein
LKHRRWGQRKLSDETIRQIAVILKTLPRCEKTDRDVGARFHVGHALIRNIALGWVTPRGGGPPPEPYLPTE